MLSLCPRAPQAAERHMPGNRCSLPSTTRNVALGATARVLYPHVWPGPHHQLGNWVLELLVRSGMMPGSMWATQHGNEDGSIPSAWWHSEGRDP